MMRGFFESLFFVACGLYTLAIWSSHSRSRLTPWMVQVFGTALLADALGTVFLCGAEATRWQWTSHSISGLAALLIMALHFSWAWIARQGGGESEVKFHRYSPWAWGLWMFAFFSGLPWSHILPAGTGFIHALF